MAAMNLIVAVDRNWAIGLKNELLVKIPQDHKFFRQKTFGKVVVMGRKTLEGLPGGLPLEGRTNVVLSANTDLRMPNATVRSSLPLLLQELRNYPSEDVYIIGGGSVYRLLLPYCDTAYVTKIFHTFSADTYFPDLDEDNTWRLASDGGQQHDAGFAFSFLTYQRISADSSAAGDGREYHEL